MSKTYESIDQKHRDFIAKQKLFFVATAPLSPNGHVNVSPKGYDSFVLIDNNKVAYLDFGGSGIETQAHLQENGRITIMFCAFEGKANILRLYGRGTAYDFDHEEYTELRRLFSYNGKARAVIVVDITRIADSCGFSVPFMDFIGERDQLKRVIDNRDEITFRSHRLNTNAESIDGLPGLTGTKT